MSSTFVGVSSAAATEPAPDDREAEQALSLAEAVEIAAKQNPDLLRAQADLERAELARRGAATPRANPAIAVEGGPRFGPAGPQADVAVSLEVPIDLGATGRRRRLAATLDLEAARARLAAARIQVSTTVRSAFAAAVAADSRVRLAADAVALAEEMERVARRRHELGEVSILEPNFAALERADAQRGLLDAEVQRARAQRGLLSVLALPAGSQLALAPPAPPLELVGGSELAGLLERAAGHPDLVATRDAASAAEADLAVARGLGAPGLSASGGWSREGDEANLVTGGVRFELPVQRNQLGVAEATGAARVAVIDAEVVELGIGRDLVVAVETWEAAQARYALAATDALPLAEENLVLGMRAYEAGKEELLAVLLLQRQALDARRAAIDAELELHRAAAALERAVGQEVF